MIFKIKLHPSVTPQTVQPFYERLSVAKMGSSLVINGREYDFGRMQDGDSLYDVSTAVDSPYVFGELHKVEGVVQMELVFPIGINAPHEAKFPESILITEDGAVTLPDACWPPVELEQLKETINEG